MIHTISLRLIIIYDKRIQFELLSQHKRELLAAHFLSYIFQVWH